MQSGGPGPDEAVPLADADIATKIAGAAARGRGTDRTPTLEQLLSAFGEREPTPEARRRAGAALDLAGVDVRPPIMEVAPGERVLLTAPGSGRSRRTGGRALGGLLALGGILAVAAVAATLAGQDNGNRASDDLPPETGAGTAPAVSTTPADSTATDTASTGTATTATETTPTTTTPAAKPSRPKRARAKPAPARVAVKVSATARPTFLCVEDGTGRQLYGGTLSGVQTFHARVVRLNIGLASTQVSVNGRSVPLSESPAGLEVSKKGGVKDLPLGRRPCG
jgi:hypothetical protein